MMTSPPKANNASLTASGTVGRPAATAPLWLATGS